MKRVIECLGGCGNVVRLYGSYKVSAQKLVKNPHTGETSYQVIEGKICKECAEIAGYVTKRQKNKTVGSSEGKAEDQVPTA